MPTLDTRGGGAVVTEAGSPLATLLHLALPQIMASLFVSGSQPHSHKFLEHRVLICPLLDRQESALSLSVRLSVYEHMGTD